MHKKYLQIIFLTGLSFCCFSQNNHLPDAITTHYIDSLHQQLVFAQDDSSKMMIIERIGFYYERVNSDSALFYINNALAIARQKNYKQAEARTLATLSGLMEHHGK